MSSNIKSVNQHYSNAYKRLGHFATAPYNWNLFYDKSYDSLTPIVMGFIIDGSIKVLASPALLPATAITASLALLGAAITALTHLIALIGAGIKDLFSSSKNQDDTPVDDERLLLTNK